MIVCHCHGITDRELLQAGRERDREARPPMCVAGTACGGCRSLVEQLLQERQVPEPRATSAAPTRPSS